MNSVDFSLMKALEIALQSPLNLEENSCHSEMLVESKGPYVMALSPKRKERCSFTHSFPCSQDLGTGPRMRLGHPCPLWPGERDSGACPPTGTQLIWRPGLSLALCRVDPLLCAELWALLPMDIFLARGPFIHSKGL